MANIIGEGSEKPILNQIKVRQTSKRAQEQLNDNLIIWNNNNDAWVKLASSVNIAEELTDILGENIVDLQGDSLLAKNNVLLGSQLNYNQENNSWSLFEGFEQTYDNTILGFRPKPSIKSIKVSHLNNGSLRRAEISIKVYSVEQLEIIDKLFLRPGYSLLLEWGHSIYLNNNAELTQFNNFTTKPFNEFFKQNTTPDNILEAISEETKNHDGNYEAFYGQILPSAWSFNVDGTYDISIAAITIGNVIESLKINKSLERLSNNTTSENKPYIELLKDISLFHRFIYDLYSLQETQVKTKYQLNNLKVIKQEFIGNKSEGSLGNKNNNVQTYITLGSLLEYLEKHQNIITDNNNNLLLKYDYQDDNYCLTFDEHLSVDPSICLIPFNFNNKIKFDKYKEFKQENNPYVGKLCYILINIEHIASLLNQLMDADKKIILFNFLKTLLDGINASLGNINKLEISYDSFTNKIKIMEKAPLRYGPLKEKKEFAQFNVYGVNNSEGSFVKSINFNVSIPKDFANMIAIGAQVNANNQLSDNSVALSELSRGLIDRTIPKKIPVNDSSIIDEPKQEFKISFNKIEGLLNELYNNKLIIKENISILSSLISDYFQIKIGELSNSKQIPTPIFIPFNLSLTMDGLGGMRIYEKFNLSETSSRILPSTYRLENGKSIIDFIIKNITHTVESNRWLTQIESFTIISESNIPIILPKNPPQQSQPDLPIVEESTEENKLRLKIKRLVEDLPSNILPKGQTLGNIDILDDNGNIQYTLKVVELPYLNNQRKISSIPKGKYNVKKRTTGKYGNHFIIEEVPNRDGILIHSANYASQLLGCQAPGLAYIIQNNKQIGVSNSKNALERLYNSMPSNFIMEII